MLLGSPIFKMSAQREEGIAFVLELLCIFLFLYTAYSKLSDHLRFESGLARVEIIGHSAEVVAWAVPIAEITTALLIVIPKTSKIGLMIFIGLMSLFTIYIVYELLTASKLPCHCGGIVEALTWRQHIWFNLGFIAVAVSALILNRKT